MTSNAIFCFFVPSGAIWCADFEFEIRLSFIYVEIGSLGSLYTPKKSARPPAKGGGADRVRTPPFGFQGPGTKQGPAGRKPARAKNPGDPATETLTTVPKCSLKHTKKARLDDQGPSHPLNYSQDY